MHLKILFTLMSVVLESVYVHFFQQLTFSFLFFINVIYLAF